MTLRHYLAFTTVCSTGSMSKAAETLFISQSAISQLIKDLENHFNTKLFYRVSHKLLLTESGKKLYNHAMHMVLYNQSIERFMLTEQNSNAIRIGTINPMVVIDLIKNYKREFPDFTFTLTHNTETNLKTLIATNEIDFAIIEKPSSITDTDFTSEFMTTMPLVFVCAKNTKLSPLLACEHPSISIDELSNFPLLLWTLSEQIRNYILAVFDKNNLTHNIAGQFIDYTSLVQFVLADYGIGLISAHNFYLRHSLFKTIEVRDLDLSKALYIVHKKGEVPHHMQQFIDYTLKNFDVISKTASEKYFMPK